VKAVGFGARGAAALSRLAASGRLSGAQLWCLDSDTAALEAAAAAAGAAPLLLPKGTGPPLSATGLLGPADMQRLTAGGGSSACQAGSLAFLLAPGAGAPGGAATVLQAAVALRGAGHTLVAALTQPFGFEGSLKRRQADELAAALRGVAHVVALTEQDALLQAAGGAQVRQPSRSLIPPNSSRLCLPSPHLYCCQ
jgi:cell division protein FtsZ